VNEVIELVVLVSVVVVILVVLIIVVVIVAAVPTRFYRIISTLHSPILGPQPTDLPASTHLVSIYHECAVAGFRSYTFQPAVSELGYLRL